VSITRAWAIVWSLALAASPAWSIPEEARAQLKGRVVDDEGNALTGATVTLEARGAKRTATADRNGAFQVEGLMEGAYVLTIEHPGFTAHRGELVVSRESPPDILVTLPLAGRAETVVVIGREGRRRSPSLESADIPGSVDILGADQLRAENVDFGVELLRKVPGVYTADYNQGIVAGDLGIRGFNTEAEIAHTALLVDGIPANLNSGFAEMNGIFPLEMDGIEIVKGTNDPRYGLHNIAGNVNVFTHRDGRLREIRAAYGAFGTTEAQGIAALGGERVSQTYFAAYRRSAGYRDHSGYDKHALSAKLFWRSASGRVRTGVIARTFDWDAEAPGYLGRDDARSTPRASPAFSATDGGDVRNRHVSAHLEYTPRNDVFGSFRAYRQTFRRQRFVRFTAAGSQQERLEDEAQYGAIVSLTFRPVGAGAHGLAVSWGADAQFQDNLAQRYQASERTRGALLRDQDFTFRQAGTYAQVEGRPVSRLRLVAGMRLDRLGGDFTNRLTGQRAGAIPYGTIPQPKAGAIVTVAKGTNAYANWGRAFQVGVGAGAFGRQDLGYSRNDGWETGLRFAPSERLAGRAAYWKQHASDEVRLKFDNSGDSENIGETRRDGFDLEVNLRPYRTVTAWGVYSRQRARIVEPGRAEQGLRGKELHHVPRYTAKAGLDVAPLRRLTVSLWWYGQGDYELTNDNALERFGSQSLWNADANVELGRYRVGAHLKNVLDRYYEGTAWYDGAVTLHAPGEGRALYLTAGVAF
jgi:iron complex outermembrane recepter protein